MTPLSSCGKPKKKKGKEVLFECLLTPHAFFAQEISSP